MTRTIDINTKEWWDKVNGNSYFAGEVITDYGMKNEKRFKMPFQYGYGNADEQEAESILKKEGIIKDNDLPFTRYCRENKIIYRRNKKKNCLKRELTE